MTRFTSLLLAAAACASVVGCSAASSGLRADAAARAVPRIDYAVSIPDVRSERFAVEATLVGLAADTLTFHFPVWAPGAYDIVNFGAYILDFEARDAQGRALTVLHADTNTFRIVGATAKTRLRYTVDDIEHLPNASWFGLSDIEADRAFANGPALFGYPEGRKEIPFSVTYTAPLDWEHIVALDPDPSGADDRYVAADYDELVDAPVMMGRFQTIDFEHRGVPHVIAVIAPDELDGDSRRALLETTRRIVEAMTGLFGEIPYDRYHFQHYLVEPRSTYARGNFGALEHANSSTYLMPYYGPEAVAAVLASVIAHEFWHLWSPKRIHVHELGPFDYQKGPETASLWFAEGLTEYYARVINTRIGLNPPQEFLGELLRDARGLLDRGQVEPMTSLSRRITTAPMREIIDLYRRGPMLGWLLDTEIRWQTRNRSSLDDAMRFFNEEYARKGRTFGDEEIIPIMERATGAQLGEFYRRYIDGRDTLPFREAFGRTGLVHVVKDTLRPSLGAVLEKVAEGIKVVRLLPGGSAEAMGMRVGDVITSIDFKGYGVPMRSIPVEYADDIFTSTGEKSGGGAYLATSVSIRRDGQPMSLPVRVLPSTATIERIEHDTSASGLALEIRRSMLGF